MHDEPDSGIWGPLQPRGPGLQPNQPIEVERQPKIAQYVLTIVMVLLLTIAHDDRSHSDRRGTALPGGSPAALLVSRRPGPSVRYTAVAVAGPVAEYSAAGRRVARGVPPYAAPRSPPRRPLFNLRQNV
ncbi:hypothetical protein EVAR_100272_1 [Eumeta japonica]|uniref:Uncharacterized protein n=1 Tax=Eumeta variegata TaxID=151549 RepID=A0A4C1SC55_EUMVA|nr:hypothetical protein EVAR_100272_1 [Eumeta japonica]